MPLYIAAKQGHVTKQLIEARCNFDLQSMDEVTAVLSSYVSVNTIERIPTFLFSSGCCKTMTLVSRYILPSGGSALHTHTNNGLSHLVHISLPILRQMLGNDEITL